MTTLTPEQLKADLEKLLPLHDKSIEVAGSAGHLVVLVLSPEYAEMGDNDRQSQAWVLLADRYGDEAASEVEFVFTLTPEEHEELVRLAAEEDAEDLDDPPARVAAGS
ncbi:MAG: hypothetical protein RIT28_866 [Pseudomonadota bacterium]|jgi:acid stress-induced BolA-like protein IbaG/YrbA